MSIDWARVMRGIHSIASASRPAAAKPLTRSPCRAGSSAPTSSAPDSAPASDFGSGLLTHRITAAPLSTSLRAPTFAPASSKSESAIEAPAPAPFSTARSAPSAANFFTVSGVAAQRVSPPASFRTAIFIGDGLPIGLDEDEREDADDQAGDRSPEHHPSKALIVTDVGGDVLSRGTDQQRLFLGHLCSFSVECRLAGP